MRFKFPTFIKARTQSLADGPGSAAPPAPIVVELSADMVRVSAIALGHPRLAVINGKTVTEGDSVTLQTPNAPVALILRLLKIGDGSINLPDGKKMFSARLYIRHLLGKQTDYRSKRVATCVSLLFKRGQLL